MANCEFGAFVIDFRSNENGEKPVMRVVARLSSAGILLLSATAVAQTEPSPLYRNADYHFAVIFPGQPMARDVTYMTKDGASVPARQFYIEQGGDRYTVTLVKLPNAAAIDKDIIEYAAQQLLKKGTARFNYSFCYDPGVPGRQLNLSESNGHQLRGSVYMWDHQLYITEASAPPGSPSALQFEQSITILDANGDDLNTGQGSPAC
jgi:hypothetical protein